MKAIVVHEYGEPNVLKLEQLPIPKPGNGQVLVRIHAAGVNPVDTYIRAGNFGDYTKLPYVPGFDGAGIIGAIGNGVTHFRTGDRVFCFTPGQGTYAEYCVCSEESCWPLPSKLTFSQGAAIGIPYFTAYNALFQMVKSKPIKTVLVHGASGGVGLAAVQLAKRANMTVYGTAGTPEGMELVKREGADFVFNHKTKDYVKGILTTLNGAGMDLILEMLANVNMPKDLELIHPKGTIAVIGSRGSVRNQKDTQAAVIWISVLSASMDELNSAGRDISNGLEDATLRPVIDKEYSMDKASSAHKDIIESPGAKGKLIISITK